jgi:hypothetical protein
MSRIIALLVAVSAALFAFIFGNEADELFVTDLAILLAGLAIILIVQAAGLLAGYWALRFVGMPRLGLFLSRVAAAGLVGSNAYFTAFMTYEASWQVQILLSVAVGAFMLPVMLIQRWQPFILFMAVFYFVSSLVIYAHTWMTRTSSRVAEGNPIRINSRRNVYLIGHESLHSPKAFRELYGLSRLPHVDYLRSHGFRVMDRAYSADSETLKTYSRMLHFGRELSDAEAGDRSVFNSMNTTFGAFSNSGYQTQFLYKSLYFHLNPDLVDYSYPRTAFHQCDLVPRTFFYFICRPRVAAFINLHLFGVSRDTTAPVVVRRMQETIRSDRPWFTLYHHAFPFHTVTAFHNYRDRRAVQRFRQRVAQTLPRIHSENFGTVVGSIIRTDPEAVIITFGDHGARLTRGADLDVPDDRFTRRQILEDRFGVMLAVYPRDFCTNRIREGITTTTLVESVVKCLNGDDLATARDVARSRIFYWNGRRRSLDEFEPG